MNDRKHVENFLIYFLEGWKGTFVLVTVLILLNVTPSQNWNGRFWVVFGATGIAVLAVSLACCRGKRLNLYNFFCHVLPFVLNTLFLALGFYVNYLVG